MELAYDGAPVGGPMWSFMTVLVIIFSVAVIIKLLRDKH